MYVRSTLRMSTRSVGFTRGLANTPWHPREFVVKDCNGGSPIYNYLPWTPRHTGLGGRTVRKQSLQSGRRQRPELHFLRDLPPESITGQNIYFSASCISRMFVRVELILPKVCDVMLMSGLPQFGWFGTLNASNRNWSA